jgi:hypothetical protein
MSRRLKTCLVAAALVAALASPNSALAGPRRDDLPRAGRAAEIRRDIGLTGRLSWLLSGIRSWWESSGAVISPTG